jgi:hypothetical protein
VCDKHRIIWPSFARTIGQNLHPKFLSRFWKQQQDSLKRILIHTTSFWDCRAISTKCWRSHDDGGVTHYSLLQSSMWRQCFNPNLEVRGQKMWWWAHEVKDYGIGVSVTWYSLVAPVMTELTFGFLAHQAIASCDMGTLSSAAIGLSFSTLLKTSSTSDRFARLCKQKNRTCLISPNVIISSHLCRRFHPWLLW